jgi:ribosomal protein L37AE/L43A
MNGPRHTESPEEAVQTPSQCPACRSRHVNTTSRTITASTYWRCTDCGEIWNVGRYQTGSQFNPRRPFGR